MSRAQKSQVQTQAKPQAQPKIEQKKSLKAEAGLNREEMEVLKKAYDLFDIEPLAILDLQLVYTILMQQCNIYKQLP